MAIVCYIESLRDDDHAAARSSVLEFRFVEHGDAELARLVELAAGLAAGHDVVGLLRHRAGDLAAGRLDQLVGRRRASAWASVPVSTKVLPASGFGFASALPSCSSQAMPHGAQLLDHLAVVRLVEEGADALRDDRADVVAPRAAARRSRRRCGRASRNAWPGPSRSSRRRGGCRARTESARASCACSSRAPSTRFCRALVGHALERGELRDAELVELGQRAHQARHRRADRPACRRAPRCPARAGSRNAGSPACAARRRTGRPSSDGRRCPSRAPRRCRTPGTGAACGSWARSPCALPGTTPTTSGITSPARRTITRVADAHALAAQLEQVVQRRVADRRAADEHRLQLGHRRELAGAADLHLDAAQRCHLLLRRVLVRDRPARLAAHEAELLLQREVVDLVDDAVDVERQLVALGGDRLVILRPSPRRRSRPRGRAAPARPSAPARRAPRSAWPAVRQPCTSPRP